MNKDLEINIMQEVDGVSAVQIVGRLDSKSVVDFEEMLSSIHQKMQAQGSHHLILSCEHLRYINSAGLAALVRMVEKYTLSSGESGLLLCSVSDQILQLFRFIGLLRIVPVYHDIPEAYTEAYSSALQ